MAILILCSDQWSDNRGKGNWVNTREQIIKVQVLWMDI